MGEFIIRVSRKKYCSSRLDVGGRENDDEVYTGSSFVEPNKGRVNGQEKRPVFF